MKTSGSYLSSDTDAGDFRLIFKERKILSNNHLGVCFWSERSAPNDYGPNHCILVITPPGAMWDYSAGNLKGAMISERFRDPNAAFNYDWQEVEVVTRRSTGEVLAAVDGVQVTNYKDPDPSRFKVGPIRLQLHGFPLPQEMQYKEISLENDPKEFKLITLKQ